MGISNVAIKTFNSSGSQSVCRANKFKEDALVESDFLTKCTTSYISGTGQTVIQGSIKGFPTGLPTQSSNHDTFNLPDDVDAISDIVLTGTINFDIPENQSTELTSYVNSTSIYFSDYLFLSMIDKIEIKLGGLIIDTITSDSIYSRNITELDGEVCKYSGSKRMCESPNVYTNRRFPRARSTTYPGDGNTVTQPGVNVGTAAIKNNKVEWSISIPFTGRGSKMSNAFLQSGSTTNTLSMKVYYNHFDPLRFHSIRQEIVDGLTGDHVDINTENSTGTGFAAWPLFGYHQATYSVNQEATNWKFSTSATVTTHMITETEKNFIRNNIINRTLNTSETLEFPEPQKLLNPNRAGSSNSGGPIDSKKPEAEYTELMFDISNFECNCSHIILSLRLPSFNNNSLTKHIDTVGYITDINTAGHSTMHLANLQRWPASPGIIYDDSKTATAPSAPNGRGPWPRSPMIPGFWSGVDHVESYSPLIPDDNRGDFNSSETITHYPLIPFDVSSPLSGSSDLASTPTSSTALVGLNPNLKKPHYPMVPKVGYVQDWLHSVELVIGGERTGFVPGTALQISQLSDYGLKNHNNEGIYVLKLSDSAFSTSGVPLSKCNSTKLNIRINNDIYNPLTTACGTAYEELLTVTNYDFTGNNLGGNSTVSGNPKLVATAVGTTVQTTVGGSISFAA